MLHLWLPLTCNSNSIYSNPVKHENEGPYRWVRKSHSSIAGQRKYLVQRILISINKKIKKNNFRVAEFRSLNTILRITLEDTRSSKMLVYLENLRICQSPAWESILYAKVRVDDIHPLYLPSFDYQEIF